MAINLATTPTGVIESNCADVRTNPTSGFLSAFMMRNFREELTNFTVTLDGIVLAASSSACLFVPPKILRLFWFGSLNEKCIPYDAALRSRFCVAMSNSRTAASAQPSIASDSMPVFVMALAASSDAVEPLSNASDASKSIAAGSIDPIRKSSAVAGGTRCKTSTETSVITLQQSTSGIKYKFPWFSKGKRSQSPYGPTINNPRFFQ
mmetsp:Transcript_52187/g.126058  ORF Transcript_52187/g.126058 Transcript_52187/m.126058 type:complete len:207 (+) Transcript_52187:1302-1922(+)